ncbi:MAG TPA: RHS repeat-associated core domain-containing protein [Hymenobacter sp.]
MKQLAVQQGDTVSITAPGLYPQATQHNFWFSLASFLTGLLQPAPSLPAPPDALRRGGLPLLQVGVAAGLASVPQLSGGVPKGYVRLLVFDADSNLVSQQTQQLSAAALNNYESLRLQVVVPQDGYVSAYVGNESNVDVYFDDVTVEHRPGLLVQENQYDPWGLNLVGVNYSSAGIKQLNQYQFGGKELQTDLGLNMQDYGWRLYDTQLGKWHGVDQLAHLYSSISPYSFTKNNPILFQEIDGRYFDWSNLNKAERKELRTVLNDLRKNDKVFNTIYNKLQASDAKFSFDINDKQKDPGTFTPDSKSEKGGAITFHSVASAKNAETTIEEFFHGFQNLFYGGKSKAEKIGGSNMEVEPRFLKTFSSFHIQGVGSVTPPGMESLVPFVIGLSPDINSLSSQEKKEYLRSVEQFRRYYADRNKSLGINNKYDDPKTNNGPDAALEILRSTRNSK